MWPLGELRRYWDIIDKHPSGAILRILLLVLSHSFACRAVVSIFITYLIDSWTYEHFQISVGITYASNAVISMMIILLAHISDKYCMDGHIIMIISTNVAYILGLILLSSSKAVKNKNIAIGEIYGSLLLLCVGEAGRSATLHEFFHNQYSSEQKPQEPDDEKYTTRRDAFWKVAWVLGAVLTFIPGISDGANASIVSAGAIGSSCLVFWFGRSKYFINSRNSKETKTDQRGSQICTDDISITPLPASEGDQSGQVCMTSTVEQETDQRNQNSTDDEEVNDTPCLEEEIWETGTKGSLSTVEEAVVDPEAQEVELSITLSRKNEIGRLGSSSIRKTTPWLAEDSQHIGKITEEAESGELSEVGGTENSNNLSKELQRGEITVGVGELKVRSKPEQPGRGELWTITKVKEKIPIFRKMMLMWASFIIYSMVDATGNTFFYGQMSNLDTSTESFALYISSLSSFSKYIISFSYKIVVTPKKWRHATLVRIGCAMVCSVLCSSAAYLVETHRLKLVKRAGLDDDSYTTISMDISWLIPQFVLHGIMRGLAEEGLVDIFIEFITAGDELMIRYSCHITDFILGITKSISLLTILVPILLGCNWFGDTINMSRVDKYYLVLIIASSVNLCYYFYVIYSYVRDKSQEADAEENEQSA
ncbi:hypothetical protein ACLB2K_034024 [Fragaria x ananassa]